MGWSIGTLDETSDGLVVAPHISIDGVGVDHVATAAPVETQRDSTEREGVEEPVERRAFVGERHVVRRGDDDHEVGGHPVRAVGAAHLPVREVADPDQHRDADLVDVEADGLLTDLHVGHRDLAGRSTTSIASAGTT